VLLTSSRHSSIAQRRKTDQQGVGVCVRRGCGRQVRARCLNPKTASRTGQPRTRVHYAIFTGKMCEVRWQCRCSTRSYETS
jgi:hypothetical protein